MLLLKPVVDSLEETGVTDHAKAVGHDDGLGEGGSLPCLCSPEGGDHFVTPLRTSGVLFSRAIKGNVPEHGLCGVCSRTPGWCIPASPGF